MSALSPVDSMYRRYNVCISWYRRYVCTYQLIQCIGDIMYVSVGIGDIMYVSVGIGDMYVCMYCV